MRALIINKPHLQTRQQKIASFCITVLSWLLWVYFLLPLFTLGGWLLGVKSLSAEIRWFGGYKTLLELLQMYGGIIAGIAVFWFFWTLFTSWHKVLILPPQKVQLDDQKLCEAFHISASQLAKGRLAKVVTVSFDDDGHITGIKSG
ncbi:MAG: poly-beta-1,6-N-acetyl-D-glucosamine biosynthesis protein PgaD [Methylococcales bacterium]